MKTTKHYHNLRLTCDDLFLADVIDKFRNYGVCPSH